MSNHSKAVRLREFLKRLYDAPAAENEQAALELIRDTLNDVEDEFTDIPPDPDRWQSDGRMYPPQADARRVVEDSPGVARYRSIAHNTLIGENGSIEIRDGSSWKHGEIAFSKLGADGQGVWPDAPPSDEQES